MMDVFWAFFGHLGIESQGDGYGYRAPLCPPKKPPPAPPRGSERLRVEG